MDQELEQSSGRRAFIRRSVAAGGLVWATPAVLSHARASAAVSGCDASLQSGGVFSIPAGATVTLSGLATSACNRLALGYEIDGAHTTVLTKPYGCGADTTGPDTDIPPVPAARVMRIFLRDETCGATFYSDGTPFNHANVTGDGPWAVGLADAGGNCEVASADRIPRSGNGRLVVSIVCA